VIGCALAAARTLRDRCPPRPAVSVHASHAVLAAAHAGGARLRPPVARKSIQSSWPVHGARRSVAGETARDSSRRAAGAAWRVVSVMWVNNEIAWYSPWPGWRRDVARPRGRPVPVAVQAVGKIPSPVSLHYTTVVMHAPDHFPAIKIAHPRGSAPCGGGTVCPRSDHSTSGGQHFGIGPPPGPGHRERGPEGSWGLARPHRSRARAGGVSLATVAALRDELSARLVAVGPLTPWIKQRPRTLRMGPRTSPACRSPGRTSRRC